MSSDLIDQLRHLIGATHVLTESQDVAPFVEDWRGRYRGEVLAVVQPATTHEVAAVVKACAQASVSIVPQGGHTRT
ncbi:MAG: FAD-binding oxidoreductase [Betaproteobacteria bacterium]|nr:FAD-binding oxidoreductase [Betaproteobacteria bacterium]